MKILRTFWNSPIGPKTTHFWGPVFGWSIPLAAVADTQKPPEMISGNMTGVMCVYSALFMRFAWMVQPRNLHLLARSENRVREMANQAATSFNGNIKKALAGLRRIDLEGLRWRVFDAKGQVLGRLASQIATVVQGKDKPIYTPNRDDGDMCIVLNAKDVCVTGRKLTDKFYRWHTGYIGHLKERSLKDQLTKDPTEVIRKAVLRMLPRNKLRDDRDRKLRIFVGNEHPFGDRPLEPYVMPPRTVREMRPRARRALIRAQKKEEEQQLGPNVKRGKKREVEAEVTA
ncbi:hypothetical protein LWI28_018860 [Acer negundo]|uniref:Mitochondrial pyruvate carrier n=1 Tax=Acer negundo TaxID=4023 RepID=A0AAD5IW33_ACENE|nr:hypothetical protein LWI28_018860 [Acer negundo]